MPTLITPAMPTPACRYRAPDDALIGMNYRGIHQGAPKVIQRIERGKVVDPDSHYFRIAPFFETESLAHAY